MAFQVWGSVLSKLLALGFVLLLVSKLFFRPRFGAMKKWFDGVINAMLIAIVIAYALQLVIWLTA